MYHRKELRITSVFLLHLMRAYTVTIFGKIFNNIGYALIKEVDWLVWQLGYFPLISILYLFILELYCAFHPKKNDKIHSKKYVEKIFKPVFYIFIVGCIFMGFYFNFVGAELYISKFHPFNIKPQLYGEPQFFDTIFIIVVLILHLLASILGLT